jgi:hypothetical protein
MSGDFTWSSSSALRPGTSVLSSTAMYASRKPKAFFRAEQISILELEIYAKKYWRQFELRSEMRKQYVASKWRGQSHIIKGKRPRGTSPLFFTAYRKFGGDIFSEIYLDHIVRV